MTARLLSATAHPPLTTGIDFSRRRRTGTYLAPGPDGVLHEVNLEVELRRDPLTKRSGRLAHFQGFHLRPADLSEAIQDSRPGCPFCPERVLKVTPLLPLELAPEGRIRRGEATLFPNLSPYDRHSVVVALTREHFLAPQQFRPVQIADGLEALQEYFQALRPVARRTYSLVTWNYMPPAGATQVHAHLQGFSTDRPGSLLEEEVRHSRTFFARHGSSYWERLGQQEEVLGERFLARAHHTTWLTAFLSRSVVSDVLVLFPGERSLEDLPRSALEEFALGVCGAMGFFAAEGVAAFNLALYPSPTGERHDHFWMHARLSPRIYFNPAIQGSDTTSWQHLLDEPFVVRSPESLAEQLAGPMRRQLGGSPAAARSRAES